MVLPLTGMLPAEESVRMAVKEVDMPQGIVLEPDTTVKDTEWISVL
jgi:hypothetical protein